VRSTAVIAALAAALCAAGAAHAGGTAKPVGGQRALAVSVPADPVEARPGRILRTLIRVVNPNDAPVPVVVRSRALSLGDDGRVTLGSAPDPRWGSRARFPAGVLRIPAQGWRDIVLSVRVPRGLRPDLYFIGFLVTPVPTAGGSMRVINQIGSFVTIDVPGPRDRRLAGRLSVPGFVLGSHVDGSLRLTNAGAASVRFWGENDTSSSPGGSLVQARLDPSLLPPGRSRSLTVSGKPHWPIGFVTLTTRVTYPGRTDAETKQLVFRRRVLVVSPWVVVALGGLVLVVVVAVWLRRRRGARAALSPVLHGG
jgi:hypothetical protein